MSTCHGRIDSAGTDANVSIELGGGVMSRLKPIDCRRSNKCEIGGTDTFGFYSVNGADINRAASAARHLLGSGASAASR
jgi:hypothetical protein